MIPSSIVNPNKCNVCLLPEFLGVFLPKVFCDELEVLLTCIQDFFSKLKGVHSKVNNTCMQRAQSNITGPDIASYLARRPCSSWCPHQTCHHMFSWAYHLDIKYRPCQLFSTNTISTIKKKEWIFLFLTSFSRIFISPENSSQGKDEKAIRVELMLFFML